MKISPEALSGQLQSGLKPIYIVSGDEHLLVQEACSLIRESATTAGHSERLIFNIDGDAKWLEFNDAASALSLFASQRILEVRIGSAKPSEAGKKALVQYAQNPAPSDVLLVVTAKLEKRVLSSAWFKALDEVGSHVPIWPIPRPQFPRWIEQRLKNAGMRAEREAVILLADLVDGNLLAAAQEIEKLKLTLSEKNLTADDVRASVADSSRYNLFALIDTALSGDARTACKMLQGLRAEGSEPLSILWGITREIRLLAQLSAAIEQGHPPGKAMQNAYVWQSRQKLVGGALERLGQKPLERLLVELARTDRILKGAARGNGWDQMERIILRLAGSYRRKKAVPV